jgi:hypothetical protein
MPDKERKQRQQRATHADTKDNIRELKHFIRKKILDNQGILNGDEEDYFMDIFEDSILSHGHFRFLIRIPYYGVIDYRNLGNFVEEYIDACAMARLQNKGDGNSIYLVDSSGKKIPTEHKIIWTAILKRINRVKSYILEEAIHMSPEREVRERPTSYIFSSKPKKQKDEEE